MSKSIEIALAADGGYFDQLFVTATSMAAYCKHEDVELRFNILDDGIKREDWELLKSKTVGLHKFSSFNRIPIDQNLFADFPTWNGNRMAYARLVLPEVLKDVKWVLYSDCDFLWLRDVAELWKERDDKFAVIAVRDQGSWEGMEKVWFARNGYEKDGSEYFCSGMCLFNLEMFREKRIINATNEVLLKHPDVPYVDQTALNVSCSRLIKLIDAKWMRFTHQLTPKFHLLPSVIHHAGEVPWRFVRMLQPLSDTMLLWHRFNAKVRGCSLWGSLRRYFKPSQIVLHRIITYVARFPVTRFMVFFLCRVSNHAGAYHFFKLSGVRYELPN